MTTFKSTNLISILQAYEFMLNRSDGLIQEEINVDKLLINVINSILKFIDKIKIDIIKYSLVSTEAQLNEKINLFNSIVIKYKEQLIDKTKLFNKENTCSETIQLITELINKCEPINVEYINSMKCSYVDSIDL